MSTLTFFGGKGEKRSAEAAFPKGASILDIADSEQDFYVYAVFAVAALRDLAPKVDILYKRYDSYLNLYESLRQKRESAASASLPQRVAHAVSNALFGREQTGADDDPTMLQRSGMFDMFGGAQMHKILRLVQLVGQTEKAIDDRTFPQKCRDLADSIERLDVRALRRVSVVMPNVRLHRLVESQWLLKGMRCVAQFAVVDPSTPVNVAHDSKILFHGSPVCNWWSILTNDLVYDKRLMRTANLHGPGIYFSDNLRNSLDYTVDHTGGVSTKLTDAAGLGVRQGGAYTRSRQRAHDGEHHHMVRRSFAVVAVCELPPTMKDVKHHEPSTYTAPDGIVRAIVVFESKEKAAADYDHANMVVTPDALNGIFRGIPRTRSAHPRVRSVVSSHLASGDVVSYLPEDVKRAQDEWWAAKH